MKVFLLKECDSCGGEIAAFSSEEARDEFKQEKGYCITTYDLEVDGEEDYSNEERRGG